MVHPLIYVFPLAFPVMACVGLSLGGAWLLLLPVVAFGLVPLAEILLRGRGARIDGVGAQRRLIHDLILVLGALMVVLTWWSTLWVVYRGHLVGLELIGAVMCCGIVLGGLGINVAHEFGHRSSSMHQWVAKLMLIPPLYLHFFIEHNRGHHHTLGTPGDPATARYGETLYAFWLRASSGGWLGAWRIEAHRLRKQTGWRRWMADEMLHMQLVQVALVVLVGALAGWTTLAVWLGSAVLAALILETVNYVEHYGLQRERLPNGRYERVGPQHSWTSDHPIGRSLLFELPRHADHHAHSGRHFAALRHFARAPQLPTGYAGMVLIACLPPLFFAMMHPHIEVERTRLAS